MNSLVRGFKTIRQVGFLPVLQLGLYRFGLFTGHYRRITESRQKILSSEKLDWIKSSQPVLDSGIANFLRGHPDLKEPCLNETEMILNGKCRIFGHQIVDIFQEGLDTSHHWTAYETGRVPLPGVDIKFIWEPARLEWIYALARANVFGEISSLGDCTWQLIDKFLKLNPVNYGPNWMNGQEVALRILALVFFHEVFRNEQNMPAGWEVTLAEAVVAHARRIPPTLVYAQSQQNNHLLVEAAGLYTAGVFLPNHSESEEWRTTGWQMFHQALNEQIQEDGTFAQFSTNYHRLMLQVALWMKAISLRAGDEFPESSSMKLAAATNWLKHLTDPETGHVPNYGHNDGAYIFPLTGSPFYDFRPVVNTADRFFGQGLFSPELDEMTLWFEWLAGSQIHSNDNSIQFPPVQSYQKLVRGKTSVVMFGPQYTSRPGQADVLHTEIWRDGNPITLDAGTYRYNADPPWDNALAQTKYHNTISIFAENQMCKAGRFLWLDWPKVHWKDRSASGSEMEASHDSYHKYGVIHNRKVEIVNEFDWKVIDEIYPIENKRNSLMDVWLHWLLPPSDWSITKTGIQSGTGSDRIQIDIVPPATGTLQPVEFQLVRAGILIDIQPKQEIHSGELVNFGWYSPSYAIKEPAYSYRILFRGMPPLSFYSRFQFG